MHIDGLAARGTVNIVLRDSSGKVKQHKTVKNMVVDQGLAHIVGRLIDGIYNSHTEEKGIEGSDLIGYTGFPKSMRYMALGKNDTDTITGNGTTQPSAPVPTGADTQLATECTIGLIPNAAPTHTPQAGRVDMYYGAQHGSQVDGFYQGIYNVGNQSISQDPGVSPEGTYSTTGAPLTQRKTGNRLVFVAFFGENHPALDSQGLITGTPSLIVTTGITEAGIFNGPAYQRTVGSPSVTTGIDQSMLCRTRFKIVNKAPQDSLQITWSVQLADQTP